MAVAVTGCSDEVPADGDEQPTEEELAGDGQPEGSEDLILESGIGVSGALTLFDDHDYTDTRRVRYSYDSSFNNDGFNDKASSLSNRTGHFWLLYGESQYRGARACIRPYSRIPDLKEYGYREGISFVWWNDKISSVKKQSTSSGSCDGAQIIGVR
jgi:hypothetical protein